ncbi:hypothetical protein BX600DRAFT_382622 [Xylariales sp. PMI_506]|nr:hypothetical protein BX600DRAFT_382622 [Xylariales sp. PMI_506]
MPRAGWNSGPHVPDDEITRFTVVSLEDAKEGKYPDFPGFRKSHGEPIPAPSGNGSSSPATRTTEHDSRAELTERDAAACSANPNVRFEWRQYSQSDRVAFVAAIKCLMNKPPSGNFPPAASRYEDFARIHQLYMPNVHQNAKFLVWHRYFLWAFEQVLRNECGFNRAMVWWDETLDAGKFAQSDIFSSAYFGGLPATPGNSVSYCINDGAYAGLTLDIGPGQSDTAHCLSRGVDESVTALTGAGYINTCLANTDYAAFERCIELGPHAAGHNGIGGTMSDVWASPSDPVFWLHHSFIDHSWRIWQNADGNRILTIDGVDVNGNTLNLNTPVYMGGIVPDTTIGAIINTLGDVNIGGTPFCYRYTY